MASFRAGREQVAQLGTAEQLRERDEPRRVAPRHTLLEVVAQLSSQLSLTRGVRVAQPNGGCVTNAVVDGHPAVAGCGHGQGLEGGHRRRRFDRRHDGGQHLLIEHGEERCCPQDVPVELA
jgi:hypothetical protein